MPQRISGFRGEFLWEWDIVERQLLQLANAFEAGDYEMTELAPLLTGTNNGARICAAPRH